MRTRTHARTWKQRDRARAPTAYPHRSRCPVHSHLPWNQLSAPSVVAFARGSCRYPPGRLATEPLKHDPVVKLQVALQAALRRWCGCPSLYPPEFLGLFAAILLSACLNAGQGRTWPAWTSVCRAFPANPTLPSCCAQATPAGCFQHVRQTSFDGRKKPPSR
jgi:hypothetical protein